MTQSSMTYALTHGRRPLATKLLCRRIDLLSCPEYRQYLDIWIRSQPPVPFKTVYFWQEMTLEIPSGR